MSAKRRATRESSSRTESRKPEPAVLPAAGTDQLQQLKDELRLVDQRLSKIGSVTSARPDAARNLRLPEKQDLLRQKAELERKIRASRSA